ncbi:MAG: right-handed parallel beta-helix repeat-containing protein, partial [Gemmatimonadetes bacterium]|nr:right-handed parallel beta-helix repeat-containing protein [Gemmatimonadota bacterium]
YVRAARSGTADAPITFSAYPGETVQLTVVEGGQPAMGTDGHDYIRFIGFIVDGGLGRFYGTGIEVAYNDVRGTFVDTPDNHDGIRIENAVGIWVHHNMIHGVTGQGVNSAGIKVYTSSDAVIEDNYIYGNNVGVYDKDSGINNTYRRNYITGNEEYQWYGNNQGEYASPKIYDNVIDGEVSLHSRTNGAEVHDNLIRGNMLAGAWAGDTWNTHLWNNVVISGGAQVTAYREPRNPFTTTEPNPHLRYMDFNVYDAPPMYRFGEYSSNPSTFNLGQMQGRGFELSSQVATGVYVDQVSYVLNESWRTAGRYGDAVGPDDVATILDLTRYGPSAR